MIYLYSGTPGSGKSLHLASVIYWTVKKGDNVIGNFEVNEHKLKGKGKYIYINNELLSPFTLTDYSREYYKTHKFREGGLLVVIDEAQILFNSRDWGQKGRSDWLSFFTQHRHFGIDVILVAQFDRMLDRQIRSLIEYEHIHRKVSNYGWKGWLLSFFCFGKLHVDVKVWYPMKERVGSNFFIARKNLYSLYDSYNSFGKFEG